MKIVEPYARIWNADGKPSFGVAEGVGLLRKIEAIARVSHRSEDRMTMDTWDRFIRTVVLNHGDWSVVEHASVTVEFEVDRGITHEIVRHRLFSYTQESTRFVNYDKPGYEARFIQPLGIDVRASNWYYAMSEAEARYKELLLTQPPQIARSVLPNSLASRLIATANLRSWRHFFVMRTTKEAHPQMKQVTIPLLEEFKLKIPILFEDIEPEMRQADAMKLAR